MELNSDENTILPEHPAPAINIQADIALSFTYASYGNIYAVTCGHVISAGAASTPAGHLGLCTYAQVPAALPPGTFCSLRCGFISDLDVALIDVGTAAVTNVATSVAQYVSPGDIVHMDGATSGNRRSEVGGAVVEHSVGGTCWNRLFLVHAPVNRGLLSPGVNVTLSLLLAVVTRGPGCCGTEANGSAWWWRATPCSALPWPARRSGVVPTPRLVPSFSLHEGLAPVTAVLGSAWHRQIEPLRRVYRPRRGLAA